MKKLILLFLLFAAPTYAASPSLILAPLTPVQLQAQLLQTGANNLFTDVVNQTNSLWALVWTNPDQVNCAPPQMVAAMGTLASSFFVNLNDIQSWANHLQSGALNVATPSTYTLTINANGSATAVHN